MSVVIPLPHLIADFADLTQTFANVTANDGIETLYTVANNKIGYLTELTIGMRNSDTSIRNTLISIYDATPTELVTYKFRQPPENVYNLVIPFYPPITLQEGYSITVESVHELSFVDVAARLLVGDE